MVKLVRWRFPDDGTGAEFFRKMDAEASLQRMKEHHDIPSEAARQWREWMSFSDSAGALLPGFPLKDALLKSKRALSLPRLRRAQVQASEIAAALIQLCRKPRRPLRTFATDFSELANDYPQLAAALNRPLVHRFVPPVWMSAVVPSGTVPGRGAWHPVLQTLDDFLTWATADVLATDSARRLGQCDFCKRFYYSKRDKSHRFCPDEDCRDLFWREKTGTERVRRSLEKHGKLRKT